LHEVHKYEKQNGDDRQRFMLLTQRKMDYLGVSNGDWIQVTIDRQDKNGGKQLMRVYNDPSVEEHTMRMPLVARNLLGINSDSASTTGYQLTLTRAKLDALEELRIANDKYEVTSLPVELENLSEKEMPTIALRSLEFLLLGRPAQLECTVLLKGTQEKPFRIKAILFNPVFNPGRAIAGLDGTFRRQLRQNQDFELILKPVM
jgi:hypothetical protein